MRVSEVDEYPSTGEVSVEGPCMTARGMNVKRKYQDVNTRYMIFVKHPILIREFSGMQGMYGDQDCDYREMKPWFRSTSYFYRHRGKNRLVQG
jgi:hypothetical protein